MLAPAVASDGRTLVRAVRGWLALGFDVAGVGTQDHGRGDRTHALKTSDLTGLVVGPVQMTGGLTPERVRVRSSVGMTVVVLVVVLVVGPVRDGVMQNRRLRGRRGGPGDGASRSLRGGRDVRTA